MIKHASKKEDKETRILIQDSIEMSKFFKSHGYRELGAVVDIILEKIQFQSRVSRKPSKATTSRTIPSSAGRYGKKL
jgi:hypothetical protein